MTVDDIDFGQRRLFTCFHLQLQNTNCSQQTLKRTSLSVAESHLRSKQRGPLVSWCCERRARCKKNVVRSEIFDMEYQLAHASKEQETPSRASSLGTSLSPASIVPAPMLPRGISEAIFCCHTARCRWQDLRLAPREALTFDVTRFLQHVWLCSRWRGLTFVPKTTTCHP